ncbi:MAG: hypothetical protein JRH10_05480 [Deltaproteobacteria bacterium]|nr:hypothetical protein [Deltaproteobacteria bacterium]MBW2445049.1 hypothetical protein [Deltaproteobacteria bacterium]
MPLRTHRRGFLTLSLKLGATAGLSTIAGLRALPAGATQLPEAAGTRAAFFSDSDRVVLEAVATRMVYTGVPEAPLFGETRALEVIDRTCSELAPEVTELLPLALRLFEWWPFFFELRFRRFSDLDPAEQDASLTGWMESRFAVRRTAFFALRNLALLGWWSQEETWPLIGYQGPLLEPEARA